MQSKKRVIAIALIIMAVIIAGLAVWQVTKAGNGEAEIPFGNNGSKGEEAPRLSSWDKFDTYWEESAEKDSSYSEYGDDGSPRYFKIRSDFMADTTEGVPYILQGSERLDKSDGANFVTVNASTGEVIWWKAPDEIIQKLDEVVSLDSDFAEKEGLSEWHSIWLGYICIPVSAERSSAGDDHSDVQTIGDIADDYANNYWSISELLDGEPTDNQILGIIGWFGEDARYDAYKAIIAHKADDELFEALVEVYGRDEVEKWQAAPIPTVGAGFVQYAEETTRLYGGDFYSDDRVEEVLSERGWSR